MRHFFGWIGAFFAGVGLIFGIIAGLLIYRDAGFASTAEKAQGTVIGLVRQIPRDDRSQSSGVTYTAVVAFRDRSGRRQEMSEGISSNPPRFSVGEAVSVLYDPAHPSKAVVDDLWGRIGTAVIFLGVALPLVILGVVFLVVDIRRARTRAHLLAHGTPIEATLLHVFQDARISRNGEHPYRVVAQASDPATGQLRRFESEPMWVDPSSRLEGQKVRVLVDPDDARRYHVDLSAI